MKYTTFFLSIFFAQFAHACLFTEEANIFRTAEENFADTNYQYVLSGTITDKKQNDQLELEYTFQVSSIHKGLMETDTIILKSPGHSCGFFSETGVHMLVFLEQKGHIEESSPRYIFDTIDEAVAAGGALGDTQEKQVAPQACTKEYKPVCGQIAIQCIQAPCPPIENTYANTCLAEQANAQVLHQGVCVTTPTTKPQTQPETMPSRIKNTPTTDPRENFVEPNTPPPFDNSIQQEVDEVPNWWQRFRAWITRVLSF